MDNKEIYNSVYGVQNVTLTTDEAYSTAMNEIRQSIVSRHCQGKDVLDVGCAIGEFLTPHLMHCRSAIGLDFSKQYLDIFADRLGDSFPSHLVLHEADAREMPVSDQAIDFAYSFSTLYYVPQTDKVISELGRVLRSGGVVALEFGNKQSLNTIITNYRYEHDNWAHSHNHSMAEVYSSMEEYGFEVLDVRRFQLFPLLTVPKKLFWLYPFTGNSLRSFLAKDAGDGRILDEIVSGLPILRNFAFRNMIIARRI